TKEGAVYILSRTAVDELVVMTTDRQPLDLAESFSNLFGVDLYSQNEVVTIADSPALQLSLIDRFAAAEIGQVNEQLARLRTDLTANANAIHPLEGLRALLQDELLALPIVDEKLRAIADTRQPDAAPVHEANRQKALREREARALQEMDTFLDQMRSQTERQQGGIGREAVQRITPDLLAGANGARLRDVRQALHEDNEEVNTHLNKALAAMARSKTRLASHATALATAHARQETTYRSLLDQHRRDQAQFQEHWQLEKQRNNLLAKQTQLEETQAQLTALQADRQGQQQQLSHWLDRRFEVRQQVVADLNRQLNPTVRISLEQACQRDHYQERLEHSLRDVRLKPKIIAQKLAQTFTPPHLVAILRTATAAELAEKADLTTEQAEKVRAALAGAFVLYDLEQMELRDEPRIELQVGAVYKPAQHLSIGQKCTTILPILLLESEKPLLIDQPEDNLDNGFISQTIVNSLLKIKGKRQVILVTHNPNIPVLGDAAQVAVLEANESSARLVKAGSVDFCKQEIVSLLEGGEAAFKQRKQRYQY
ncbi:MAG: hypothetical protein ACRDFS_09630, partial [Chloroflexota bacterium]